MSTSTSPPSILNLPSLSHCHTTKAAKKVLDTTRNPVYPSDAAHTYNDKYLLAELATQTAAASVLDAFETSLPRWAEHKAKMHGWASENKTVTLRSAGSIQCEFSKTAERTVESATAIVATTRRGTASSCPSGHGLTQFSTPRLGFSCDLCDAQMPEGATLYGCRQCDYDVCALCRRSAAASINPSGKGSKEKTTTVKTTVVEHYWRVSTNWEISAYVGADPADKVVLATGAGVVEQVTRGFPNSSPSPPRPEVSTLSTNEAEISWLLSTISSPPLPSSGSSEVGNDDVRFAINRDVETCKTPRRNKEVDTAIAALQSIRNYVHQTANFLLTQISRVDPKSAVRGAPQPPPIFSPILTMFSLEEPAAAATAAAAAAAAPANGVTLSGGDLSSFLSEHQRSMKEHVEIAVGASPASAVISPVSVGIFALFVHVAELCADYTSAVGAIEALLRAQLIAAIGKEVQPKDFAEYMDYHNRKLFKDEHAPERFCYAIRREGRYPDGTVSIEQAGGDNMPLLTSVVKQKAVRPMKIALNAATEVSFMGDRYVHAAIMQSFSGQNAANLKLVARAKQFSSFILLAGKITAADQFEPTAAVIVKDKDDLSIPLLLETIPTPKEFRDAIESLSPEQQRFAKAYRSLQLSSTLFGVCIVQVKPQLERVLNLPDNSLTKEIQLTQDLMEMFIKYQVPSDLLSYDAGAGAGAGAGAATGATGAAGAVAQADKIAAVKEHVGQIKAVIAAQREAELAAVAEAKAKALLELAVSTPEDDSDCDDYAYTGSFGGVAPACASFGGPPGASFGGQARAFTPGVPQVPGYESAVKMTTPPQQLADAASSGAPEILGAEMDYTALPALLDSKFAELDTDSALRPTIIKMGPTWSRKSQAGLLSKPTTSSLQETEQKEEKNQAFDLLDALTRSGVLAVVEASLHVVLAATHCFDKTVVNAVVQDNINPVEKVERSVLIVSSAISGLPAQQLINQDQLERVQLYSPMLLPAPA